MAKRLEAFDPTPYLTDVYVPNGRAWRAWDCWGLLCAVFEREAGIRLDPWDTVDCADKAAVASASAVECTRGWTPLSPHSGAFRPLDVLQFLDSGRPTHVGVVIDGPVFLHARRDAGTCVGSLADRRQPWSRRLVAAYRHPLLA